METLAELTQLLYESRAREAAATRAAADAEAALQEEDFAFGNPSFVATSLESSESDGSLEDEDDVSTGDRPPDLTAGTVLCLYHPEQEDGFVSHQSAEILQMNFKDNSGTGRPAPAFFEYAFSARLGQRVVVATDWYRHMDDLGEREVPVLVTACDDYGELYDVCS